jgi:hypothetical protein
VARVVVSYEARAELLQVRRSSRESTVAVAVDDQVVAEVDPTGELVGVRVSHPQQGFDLDGLVSRWRLDDDVRNVLADLYANRGLLPRFGP